MKKKRRARSRRKRKKLIEQTSEARNGPRQMYRYGTKQRLTSTRKESGEITSDRGKLLRIENHTSAVSMFVVAFRALIVRRHSCMTKDEQTRPNWNYNGRYVMPKKKKKKKRRRRKKKRQVRPDYCFTHQRVASFAYEISCLVLFSNHKQ